MKWISAFCLMVAAAFVCWPVTPANASTGRRFEWSTKSQEARQLLAELQSQIENFQLGPRNLEIAKKMVAADPNFAIGQYYLSVVTPDQAEALKIYDKSREL